MRALVVACLALVPLGAAADEALRPIPVETLRALGPTVARGDMALFELDAERRTRQLTLLAYTRAAPATVREVVVHPERWKGFIRNLSRSDVEKKDDGAVVVNWRVELPIGHFDGHDEMRVAGEAAGPVEVRSVGPGNAGRFRWEFIPVAGGGTLIVYYGHYDGFAQIGLLARMLARNPLYASGLALSEGLVLVKGVQAEAARREAEAARVSGGKLPALPTGSGPGFAPLLDRGTLAILRSDKAGSLVDISVVERIPRPLGPLLETLRSPETWPRATPSVKRCSVLARDPGGLDYRVDLDAIFMEINATMRLRFIPGGVDALCIDGDIKGSRYRWDLSSSGAGRTLAVYRGNAHLGEGSTLMRALFAFEPLFEHTGNVTVGIFTMRAMMH